MFDKLNSVLYQHRVGFADGDGNNISFTSGGIVGTYYAGSLLRAFSAGYFSDINGRMSHQPPPAFWHYGASTVRVTEIYEGIKGIWVAICFCMLGVIPQSSAVNLVHMAYYPTLC